MGVRCRTAHHTVIISGLDEQFIDYLNIIFIHCDRSCIRLRRLLSCNEHVVAKRLDLNVIIEIKDLLERLVSLKKLSCGISVLAKFLI